MANKQVTLKRVTDTSGNTDNIYPTTEWAQIENKPTTFTPTSHTHDVSEITGAAINPRFEVDLTSTGNLWYKVASVNLGSGGLSLRGALNNHVESFGTQSMDLHIFGREADNATLISVDGTFEVAHPGVGVRVLRISEGSPYAQYDVYIKTVSYTQAKIDVIPYGSTVLWLGTAPASVEPSGSYGVEFDNTTVGQGAYYVGASIIRTLWHQGNFTPSSYVTKSGDTMTGQLTISTDANNEQLVLRRASNNNEQLILGVHSSDYSFIQAVEQNVDYRPLTLQKDGGAVGIGTTSPGRKLDVNGSSRFRDTAFFGSSDDQGLISWNANGFVMLGQSGKGMAFGANGSNDHMYITTGGNVGIGTLNPPYKFSVAGVSSSDGQILFQSATSRYMNNDPRWDGDLGRMHIWATKADGTTYGQAGLALYDGDSYNYIDSIGNEIRINNNAVITAGNIGSQSVTASKYVTSDRGQPSNSLQYWEANGLGIDEAPTGDWYNTIRMSHGLPLSYYSNTLAVKMTGSGVGDIYTQTITEGTRQGWKKHWNDGNDGSGSGLEADTVDGAHASGLVQTQSFSDFPSGTLVRTSIDYSQWAGDSFQFEIEGKSYGGLFPYFVRGQGYIYNDTIINQGVFDYSANFPTASLKAFNLNGVLCFWWPSIGYWNSFAVRVYQSTYAGNVINRVTSIENTAIPSGRTKEVGFNIRSAITSANIGSQSVNYAAFSGWAGIVYLGGNSGKAIVESAWAGTSGYPGYLFTGGNSRFGFSSTNGYIDVYTDGNFYAGIDLNGQNNLVWHAGNDGSGSGLDADLLDGFHWDTYGKNIRGTEIYSDSWLRNYNTNTGLYNQATGVHWYSTATDQFSIYAGSSSGSTIRFMTSGGTVRGYVHANDGNNIGFLNNAGGWALRTDSSNNTHITNGLYVSGSALEVQGNPVWHEGNLTFSLSGTTLTIYV